MGRTYTRRVRALWVSLLGVLVATPAHAERVVALTHASDARQVIALGPTGQVYEPDGAGGWLRRRGGGVAAEVLAVARAGDVLFAGTRDAPLFRRDGDTWAALHVQPRARPIVGTGPRALAAIGRTLFALDVPGGGPAARPSQLATAPAAIVALAGTAASVVVATERGVFELRGKSFQPLKRAPATITRLVSDRWALVKGGAAELRSGKSVSWPAGFDVSAAAGSPDGALVAAASDGRSLELFTVRAGKLAREVVPVELPAHPADIVADRHGRIVIALRDGRLALRDGGVWRTTAVRDELAPPRPGPPPAASR
jgi:hypothetical protein